MFARRARRASKHLAEFAAQSMIPPSRVYLPGFVVLATTANLFAARGGAGADELMKHACTFFNGLCRTAVPGVCQSQYG